MTTLNSYEGSMGYWDPQRDTFRDYDPISEARIARDEYAAELAAVRRRFRALDVDPQIFDVNLIRKVALDNYRRKPIAWTYPNPPDKLTVDKARQWARRLWDFGCGPCKAHGNEYYSRCGADDAYGEAQDEARSHALAIWRTVGRFD